MDDGAFAGFANTGAYLTEWNEIPPDYSHNVAFEVEGTDWYGFSVSEVLDKVAKSWDDVNSAANRYDKKIAGATWVIYYPVGTTVFNGVLTANDTIARAILNALESSGGVAVPDEIQEWMDDALDREAKGKWRIELIAPPSSTSSQFVDRLKYLDTLKIRAFGLTERSILEGQHGTKAEADIHGDVALSIIDTRHKMICTQLNSTVVPKLMELNFGKEFRSSVSIRPAPIVDSQFATLKEIYRTLLQNPEIAVDELYKVDVKALRDEMGIPTRAGASEDVEIREREDAAAKDAAAEDAAAEDAAAKDKAAKEKEPVNASA